MAHITQALSLLCVFDLCSVCNLPLETGRSKRSGCTKENAITFSKCKTAEREWDNTVHVEAGAPHNECTAPTCTNGSIRSGTQCKMPYAFLLTVFHLYLSEICITIASNKSVEIIQKNVKENTETQHPVDPPL